MSFLKSFKIVKKFFNQIKIAKILLIMILFVLIFTVLIFSSCVYRPSNAKRMVFIGLDGAAWKFIEPLISKGELPTFKKLIDNGVHGYLKTLRPTQSVIIWSSILTGCLPAKHGIKGWLSGAGDQLAITSTMRHKPALWDIMTQNGKKGLYLNWWTSWPANKVKGMLISNLLFFKGTANRIYPLSRIDEIDRMVSEIKKRHREDKSSFKVASTSTFLTDNMVFKLAEKVSEKGDYDIIALYVRGLDITEHEYYAYSHPEEFSSPPKKTEQYKNWIDDYYRLLDRRINHLLVEQGRNIDVMIMSDHGMEALTEKLPPIAKLLINSLLAEMNFFQAKNEYEINWQNTRVYQYGYQMQGFQRKLRLNSKRWRADGIISLADENAFKMKIVGLLSNLKVTSKASKKTRKLFSEVTALSGQKADITCFINNEVKPNDIITLPNNHKTYTIDHFLTHFLSHRSGQHVNAPPGIIIMSGPSFQRGRVIENCSVIDVLPIALRAMKLPIGADMDGKVMKQALIPKIANAKQIAAYKLGDFSNISQMQTQTKKDVAIPGKVELKLRQNLRSLGYIQ